MDEMRLRIAERCERDLGRLPYIRQVAMAAVDELPPAGNYKQRIKARFKRENPEVSSIVLIFVLPLVISLVSQWIIRVIWDEQSFA